jgi:hypothetical protein
MLHQQHSETQGHGLYIELNQLCVEKRVRTQNYERALCPIVLPHGKYRPRDMPILPNVTRMIVTVVYAIAIS